MWWIGSAGHETLHLLCEGAFIHKLSALKLFVLKLLATKNKALLIRWYALHILDLLLHILNGVTGLQLELDYSIGKHPHKNLHTSMQTKDEAQCRLCLDV